MQRKVQRVQSGHLYVMLFPFLSQSLLIHCCSVQDREGNEIPIWQRWRDYSSGGPSLIWDRLCHLSALKTVIIVLLSSNSPTPVSRLVTLSHPVKKKHETLLELIRPFKINKINKRQPKSHSQGFTQPEPPLLLLYPLGGLEHQQTLLSAGEGGGGGRPSLTVDECPYHLREWVRAV